LRHLGHDVSRTRSGVESPAADLALLALIYDTGARVQEIASGAAPAGDPDPYRVPRVLADTEDTGDTGDADDADDAEDEDEAQA